MEIGALTKSEPLQAWLPYDEDTEILIQYVPRDVLQGIYKKAMQNVYKPELADRLLSERAVKDWRKSENGKGFTLDGQPYPFSAENAAFLMTRWNEFSRFVNDACINLDLLVRQEKATVAKNSSNTSGQN